MENSDSESTLKIAPFEKITINTNYKIKTSLEEPPTDLELKPLLDNLEYVFLEEPSFLPVIISSQLSKEKKSKLISVLKKHKQAFAWKTTDIPGICPSFCKHKIQLLDDKKPVVQKQRMIIQYAGMLLIEIDKTSDFSKIARPLTKLLEKDTPFEFDDECRRAFESLKEKLTCAPVIVSPNWNLPFELMCDASDFAIGAVLGNLARRYGKLRRMLKIALPQLCISLCPGKYRFPYFISIISYHIEGNVQLKCGGEPNRKN
ncbi:reverse transcriptase domain-containing protein [Tanacetum coccineum]